MIVLQHIIYFIFAISLVSWILMLIALEDHWRAMMIIVTPAWGFIWIVLLIVLMNIPQIILV